MAISPIHFMPNESSRCCSSSLALADGAEGGRGSGLSGLGGRETKEKTSDATTRLSPRDMLSKKPCRARREVGCSTTWPSNRHSPHPIPSHPAPLDPLGRETNQGRDGWVGRAYANPCALSSARCRCRACAPGWDPSTRGPPARWGLGGFPRRSLSHLKIQRQMSSPPYRPMYCVPLYLSLPPSLPPPQLELMKGLGGSGSPLHWSALLYVKNGGTVPASPAQLPSPPRR